MPSEAPEPSTRPAATGLDRLHQLQYRGAGVRIAVIDSDFTGWQAHAGKELPKSTTLIDLTATRNFTLELSAARFGTPKAVQCERGAAPTVGVGGQGAGARPQAAAWQRTYVRCAAGFLDNQRRKTCGSCRCRPSECILGRRC